MNLSDRTLLVQLSISQWTARKYDKKTTKQVADSNGVAMDVGRYNKALLPASDMLDKVHKYSAAVRQEYYANTLPWGIDGTQMLPTSNYLNFVSEFRKHKSEWQSLVNKFVEQYQDLKDDAKAYLGPLYNEADYPSGHEIANKFRMDMAVFPVPTNDFRCEIASDELDRIRADVERRVEDAGKQAMQEVWQRLYDRVVKMSEKLNDPASIFRDSLVENAREICAMLPRLNFMDDPDLETMRQEVEAKLTGFHPDTLRHDLDVRRQAATDATDIINKMKAFMGGAA